MRLIEWSKKDTSIFIELLKERNCLWQIKLKFFFYLCSDFDGIFFHQKWNWILRHFCSCQIFDFFSDI